MGEETSQASGGGLMGLMGCWGWRGILWNGCSHSEISFQDQYAILTVTSEWNTGETVDKYAQYGYAQWGHNVLLKMTFYGEG